MFKNKLLFLSTGPIFAVPNPQKFNALSKSFDGVIITACFDKNISAVKMVNRFQLIAIPYIDFEFKVLGKVFSIVFFQKVRLFTVAFFTMLKFQLKQSPIHLIITPDPIRCGLMGLALAFIFRCKVAPEVNGVHTSKAVYLDIKNPLQRKLRFIIYPLIEKFVLSRSDGIKTLFPSQLAPFGNAFSKKRIACFPDYVPINNFLNTKAEEKDEILFVGHPYHLKGVDLLIEAFKKLYPSFPNWSLKILGWFTNAEELLKDVDSHPAITITPPVNHHDMPFHMGSCAILVLPSRTEAMGRVLIEAMAMGKPRIGSNVEGIPTVINDSIDGLLFECGNSNDLMVKLRTLMENPQLRKQMGNAARTRALLEFSEEKYIEKLTNFYKAIIADEKS